MLIDAEAKAKLDVVQAEQTVLMEAAREKVRCRGEKTNNKISAE
jgi:hypothetical protein